MAATPAVAAEVAVAVAVTWPTKKLPLHPGNLTLSPLALVALVAHQNLEIQKEQTVAKVVLPRLAPLFLPMEVPVATAVGKTAVVTHLAEMVEMVAPVVELDI